MSALDRLLIMVLVFAVVTLLVLAHGYFNVWSHSEFVNTGAISAGSPAPAHVPPLTPPAGAGFNL